MCTTVLVCTHCNTYLTKHKNLQPNACNGKTNGFNAASIKMDKKVASVASIRPWSMFRCVSIASLKLELKFIGVLLKFIC